MTRDPEGASRSAPPLPTTCTTTTTAASGSIELEGLSSVRYRTQPLPPSLPRPTLRSQFTVIGLPRRRRDVRFATLRRGVESASRHPCYAASPPHGGVNAI